ncbi:MAG TPA: hypothetical protein VKR24_11180 [Candidatus Limnocylindrales bacterium]|nr:hypothetical protein [Candidatus Limnocylindrales bacterium]
MSPERRSRATGQPPALTVAPEQPPMPAADPRPADDLVRAADPIPFDRASDPDESALTVLATELGAAGRRARNRKAQASAAHPDPGFVEALRGHLLAPGSGLGGAAFGGVAFAGAAVAGAGVGTSLEIPVRTRPAAPATRSRRSGRALRAWAVFALVVVLLVAAAGLLAGRLVATPANRASDVAGATLIRGGTSSTLVAGTSLQAGDEIRVASTGHATLQIGSSLARLAPGADVQLSSLSASAVRLALVDGRAYNRVNVPAGGSYAVATGPYAWTATGTAFDLSRTTLSGGGTQVVLLALQHSTSVTGPAGTQVIPEGSAATAVFGSPASDGLTVAPIPASDFLDPWLIANAKSDEALGYPIGALAGVALAPNGTPTTAVSSPTGTPSDTPSSAPSDTPGSTPVVSPSSRPAPSVTPVPTPRPTPTPTASPSPSPTPTPTATPALGLSLTSCPGGVVINWSKYSGPGFVRYVTLRSGMPTIPAAYNSGLALAGSSTGTLGTTSAADPGNDAGATYFYRTLALGANNKVLQASQVVAASGASQFDLGPASVVGPVVVWSLFNQPACFSDYKVLYSGSQDGFITISSRLQTNTAVPDPSGFSSGDTIFFRVQVLRVTPLGQFVVAQTTGSQPSYTYP